MKPESRAWRVTPRAPRLLDPLRRRRYVVRELRAELLRSAALELRAHLGEANSPLLPPRRLKQVAAYTAKKVALTQFREKNDAAVERTCVRAAQRWLRVAQSVLGIRPIRHDERARLGSWLPCSRRGGF